MTFWDGIVACGLLDDPAISMEQLLNSSPEYEEVIKQTIRAFGNVFGAKMEQKPFSGSVPLRE